MNATSIIAIVYGMIIALGGVMGYVQAKSPMSLFAGVASGAILVVAGLAMRRGLGSALPVALAVTVLLLGFFGSRFLQSGKMMPGGMTVILSLIALVAMIATSRKTTSREL